MPGPIRRKHEKPKGSSAVMGNYLAPTTRARSQNQDAPKVVLGNYYGAGKQEPPEHINSALKIKNVIVGDVHSQANLLMNQELAGGELAGTGGNRLDINLLVVGNLHIGGDAGVQPPPPPVELPIPAADQAEPEGGDAVVEQPEVDPPVVAEDEVVPRPPPQVVGEQAGQAELEVGAVAVEQPEVDPPVVAEDEVVPRPPPQVVGEQAGQAELEVGAVAVEQPEVDPPVVAEDEVVPRPPPQVVGEQVGRSAVNININVGGLNHNNINVSCTLM